MDLEDQFWIEPYLSIECLKTPEPFGILIQSFVKNQFDTAVFEPFDSAAISRAVSWHSALLVDRMFPLADELFDVEAARSYEWDYSVTLGGGVFVQRYTPKESTPK